MSFNIIVKDYQHYNRAMGKHIKSKRHYNQEMAKGGYVPLEQGKAMADAKQKEHKWKPSKECLEATRHLMSRTDKNIVLAHYPKLVDLMVSKGMKFETPNKPTDHGGFD